MIHHVPLDRMVKVSAPTRKISYQTYLFCVAAIVITCRLVGQYPWWTDTEQLHKKDSTIRLPTIHRETIQGTDVLFAEPKTKVKGILFVAHGCSHSHLDWFVDCEGCLGLPEERAIVQIGLDHGLVVVAISSSDRQFKCWHLSNDITPLGNVLKELSKRYQSHDHEHDSIPILAFGASSGGAFVSGIATPLKERFGLQVAGFLSQIAAVYSDKAVQCQVYITMNRDERTDTNAKILVQQAMSDPNVQSKQIRLAPLPIRSDHFSSRIPEVTFEQSQTMWQSLRTAGFLDAEGFLLDDPRQSRWREALRSTAKLQGDSLLADESPISEVMNVAYSVHEMTRDGVSEALEFCLNTSSV